VTAKTGPKATANKAAPGKGVRRNGKVSTDNPGGGKAASNPTPTHEAMRKAASPEPAMAETSAAKAPVTSTSAAASER